MPLIAISGKGGKCEINVRVIVDKVIELALKGDRHCLKMCMDRIVPAHKAVEIKHEHQDLGINIIVESVKAIEKQEAEEQATFEGEVIDAIDE